jgi:hypothetical protein
VTVVGPFGPALSRADIHGPGVEWACVRHGLPTRYAAALTNPMLVVGESAAEANPAGPGYRCAASFLGTTVGAMRVVSKGIQANDGRLITR